TRDGEAAESFRAALTVDVGYAEAAQALAEVPVATPTGEPLSGAERWNALAMTLYQAGRFQEALAHTERALHIDPASQIALNNKAIILFRLGRREEALAAGEQAIELSPCFGAAWFSRGAMLND